MSVTPAFERGKPAYHLNVPLGTKVQANWGAMFPLESGEVIRTGWGDEHLIRWEDGKESWNKVRTMLSPNGSPIGVWLV